MKITITYKDCEETPDGWIGFTRVLHFSEADTLKVVFEKIVSGLKQRKSADVELHFDNSDEGGKEK